MPVYIVTGKLGGGKSLVSVHRIKEYLARGAIVATNLDLRLDKMFNKSARNLRVIRVPDKPTVEDLLAIGRGNESYDESLNGLLVLDECGTWFNARNWNDKTRKAVNDWFLHARKLGWDVILIVQDISILDSQARDAIAEHTAFCRRLDRVSVPYVGQLWKLLTGSALRGPRVHSARVVYGTSPTDLLADRWVYRGVAMYSAYDTKQRFLDDYPHGTHSLLTPWHLKGRYIKPWTPERLMRLTKIHWKRFQTPIAIGAAVFLGIIASTIAWPFMQAFSLQRAAMVEQLAAVDVIMPRTMPAEDLPAVDPRPRPVEDLAEDPAPAPATVSQQFAGFTIAANVRNPSKQYYLLRGAAGEVLTDSQIRSMGLRVYTVSECELMITDAADPANKAHVFASGCTPSDGNRRRNLRELPYFADTRPLL